MQNQKKFKTALISIGGLLLTLGMSSQGNAKEFYKWVDSNGSTHYSANPPPKNARHKTTVTTYGHNVSASSSSSVTPVNTPQNDSQHTNSTSSESPKPDQLSEANAALQKGQLQPAPH